MADPGFIPQETRPKAHAVNHCKMFMVFPNLTSRP